jgi:transcriptional regulator with XRE-family HTH domain
MASESSYGFGELLQTFRLRRHLTQQQLAAQLGVHRNTIGGWERGMSLPESKSLVLELVKLLRLTDQEARQLLEASFTSLAPLWHVPYPRTPFFTGREETLEALPPTPGVHQAP